MFFHESNQPIEAANNPMKVCWMESLQLTHTNPFWFLAAALSSEMQTSDLGLH